MKKSWNVLVAFAVAGLLMVGCSTGSGSSDDPAGTATADSPATANSPGTTSNTPATTTTGTGQPSENTDITPLVGIWKAVDVDTESTTTFTDTTTITITAKGTYTRLCVSVESLKDHSQSDDIVSYACMGTITRSGSTMTTHITKEYESDDALSALPTSGWVNTTASETTPFYIRNGVLYNACFTQQGSVNGIIGTWVCISQTSETDEGSLQVEDDTVTHTIGATTIQTTDHEVYYPANYPSLTDIENYVRDSTYVAKDADTITVTETPSRQVSDWDYFIDGNTLVIVSDLGTELIKQ